ncbi:MAG: hypothetical protein PHF51_04725 [Candidatus ainarchaeum sp.]|nr:hypothetical protein [Candidatus ainarchaeum sp.]
MRLKAQSATEFLLTYSWAIIIMLVFVAALYYLGVVGVAQPLQRSCTFPAGLGCSSFKLMKNATAITVVISGNNGLGYDIGFDSNASNLAAENLGGIGMQNYTGTCSPSLVRGGDKYTCIFNISEMERVPAIGAMESMDLTLAYRNCETDPGYLVSGNCRTALVQNRTITGRLVTQMEQYVYFNTSGNGACDDNLGETAADPDCAPYVETVALNADPSFLYANASNSSNIYAWVYDQNATGLGGASCTFGANGSILTISPPATRTTNASGYANVTGFAGTTPGTVLLNVTCGNATKSVTAWRYLRILNLTG